MSPTESKLADAAREQDAILPEPRRRLTARRRQSAARAVQEVGLAGLSMGPVAIPKSPRRHRHQSGRRNGGVTLDLIDCVAARLYGRLELTLDPDLRIVGNPR